MSPKQSTWFLCWNFIHTQRLGYTFVSADWQKTWKKNTFQPEKTTTTSFTHDDDHLSFADQQLHTFSLSLLCVQQTHITTKITERSNVIPFLLYECMDNITFIASLYMSIISIKYRCYAGSKLGPSRSKWAQCWWITFDRWWQKPSLKILHKLLQCRLFIFACLDDDVWTKLCQASRGHIFLHHS